MSPWRRADKGNDQAFFWWAETSFDETRDLLMRRDTVKFCNSCEDCQLKSRRLMMDWSPITLRPRGYVAIRRISMVDMVNYCRKITHPNKIRKYVTRAMSCGLIVEEYEDFRHVVEVPLKSEAQASDTSINLDHLYLSYNKNTMVQSPEEIYRQMSRESQNR